MIASLFFSAAFVSASRDISFSAPGQAPEGFTYSKSLGKFLVGSVYKGDIKAIALDGSVTTLIPNPWKQETSNRTFGTFGVKTDNQGNIYACFSEFSKLAISSQGMPSINPDARSHVAVFDKSGNIKFSQPLPQNPSIANGSVFCNDLAIDSKDGSIYAADSATNYIWKVTENSVTVAATTPALFLDGIVRVEGGTFYVTDYTGKKMIAVKNGNSTPVEGISVSLDGLSLSDDGRSFYAVNSSHYHIITIDETRATSFKAIALPDQQSFGTSIVPFGSNQVAVSNVYGFSPDVANYVINILDLPLNPSKGRSRFTGR